MVHPARNGYEASTVISTHRPSFAIVDRDSLRLETDMLIQCLLGDSRVPGLKVILATRSPESRPGLAPASGVVGVLHKPFAIADILASIEGVPVQRIPADA